MKKSSNILLLFAFLSGLVAYNLWPFLGSKVFYVFIAVQIFLFSVITFLESRKTWKLIAQVIMLACLNSLIDELFFDPSQIDTNEYIGFGLIILTTIIFYGKGRKRRAFRR